MRKTILVLIASTLVLTLGGCAAPAASADEVRSSEPRETELSLPSGDMGALVEGNGAFAFDLYHQLAEDSENLFYSPHSISLALAMTYAGARGETGEQMAQALRFGLPEDRLHTAFNGLDQEL